MTTIKQDPDSEVEPEVLAKSIERIANAMNVLTASRLKFDTIVMLVAHASKVGKTDTHNVLVAARDLAKTYLKPASATTPKQLRKPETRG